MTDAIAKLRKLAEVATPAHTWTCHCDACCSYISGKRQLERALPLLLDLVEKADRRRGDCNCADCKSFNEDYDTARAALAKLEMP